MKKEKKIIWTDVLSKDDIAYFTTLMFDFREGKISFVDFVKLGEQKGYVLKPNVDAILKNVSAGKYKDSLMEKLEKNTVTYRDVKKFILSNDDYEKILMEINRVGIGIASEYGDERAIFMMKGINISEYNRLHGKEISEPIYDDEIDDFNFYLSNPNLYIEDYWNKKYTK